MGRNQGTPSWKARKKPPKGYNKNRPFVFFKISKDSICHILYSRAQYSEQVGFDSAGLIVIVDNSANAHIFSEEEMLTNKIEPVVSNGVATIGRNDIIEEEVGTVIWS